MHTAQTTSTTQTGFFPFYSLFPRLFLYYFFDVVVNFWMSVMRWIFSEFRVRSRDQPTSDQTFNQINRDKVFFFFHFLHEKEELLLFLPLCCSTENEFKVIFKSLWLLLLGGAAVQLITRGRLKTDRLSLLKVAPATADWCTQHLILSTHSETSEHVDGIAQIFERDEEDSWYWMRERKLTKLFGSFQLTDNSPRTVRLFNSKRKKGGAPLVDSYIH